MPPEYDVAVAYRIYPKVSRVPPVFPNDKYKLSELCLKSFKDSLGSLKVKMFVLLDNCPPNYEDLFKRYFDEQDLELIKLNGVGNRATFDLQIDTLLDQTFSEIVYFAEDDYLYLPNQFESMVKFLRDEDHVDFVSPYDHLDYYVLDLHNQKNFIKFYNDKHWRTAASTCLTFLTTKTKLRKTQTVFQSYTRGNDDVSLWISLTKRRLFNPLTILRYRRTNGHFFGIILHAWQFCWRQILFGKRQNLWVPIPSMATHLESDHLAPNFCWITKHSETTIGQNTRTSDKQSVANCFYVKNKSRIRNRYSLNPKLAK
ncbi:MAG: glycosyltransferase family 2 protein [Halobacteriota archaeon]